jgi:hypothetical protein
MLALIRVAKIHGYEWRHRTVVAGQHGGIEQYWQDNMAAIAQIIVRIISRSQRRNGTTVYGTVRGPMDNPEPQEMTVRH